MCVLAILDGWGVGKKDESNPIYMAKTPAIRFIEEHFPNGALQASGISIGLPWDTPGSSELGHFSIGAGRIVYQNYPRISLAIRDGSFFENQTIKNCLQATKKNAGVLHLLGTFSKTSEKSAIEHLQALCEMAKKEGIEKIILHLAVSEDDGTLATVEKMVSDFEHKKKQEHVAIGSITGEYFIKNAMQDTKTNAALLTMLETGSGRKADTLTAALQKASEKNASPDFIEPTLLPDGKAIERNDGIIFWNFEPDGWQFVTQSFEKKGFGSSSIVTLTRYPDVLAVPAFPEEKCDITLGKALADAGKTQLRVAETLREPSITYYLNGLREKPYDGEYRTILPSPRFVNAAEHPELSLKAVTDRTLMALTENAFDCIIVNFANPDVLAATGDYAATKKAIELVDEAIEKITNAVLSNGHTLIIVGSHSNAEGLVDLETGKVNTQHKTNSVPFYLVQRDFMKKEAEKTEKSGAIGILADVAPTILELMGIQKPTAMTGESLLRELV